MRESEDPLAKLLKNVGISTSKISTTWKGKKEIKVSEQKQEPKKVKVYRCKSAC